MGSRLRWFYVPWILYNKLFKNTPLASVPAAVLFTGPLFGPSLHLLWPRTESMVSVRGLALQPGPVSVVASGRCGGALLQLALGVTLDPRVQAIHCVEAIKAGSRAGVHQKICVRQPDGENASGRDDSRTHNIVTYYHPKCDVKMVRTWLSRLRSGQRREAQTAISAGPMNDHGHGHDPWPCSRNLKQLGHEGLWAPEERH